MSSTFEVATSLTFADALQRMRALRDEARKEIEDADGFLMNPSDGRRDPRLVRYEALSDAVSDLELHAVEQMAGQ